MWLCWHGNSSGKRYVYWIFFFFSTPVPKPDDIPSPNSHTKEWWSLFFLFLYFLVVVVVVEEVGGGPIKHPCSFKRMRVHYTSGEQWPAKICSIAVSIRSRKEHVFISFGNTTNWMQIQKHVNWTWMNFPFTTLLPCGRSEIYEAIRPSDWSFPRLKTDFFPVSYCHRVVGNIYDNKLKIKSQIKSVKMCCHI